MYIAILGLVFILTAGLSFYIASKVLNRHLDERLLQIRMQSHQNKDEWVEHPLMSMLEKFFAPLIKWSMPKEDWDTSTDKVMFLNAGLRSKFSVIVFFGLKTFLTLLLPSFFLLIYSVLPGYSLSLFALSSACFSFAVIGYYAPGWILKQMIKLRKRELFESFPDALDLMRVCVSAGLGLDGAIARVGEELVVKSKALADEFHILNLELRAGISREQALRNLALRTGVEDINALVAMLIQSERFGTSVTESLRVHADLLRNKRKMLAQEAAAKIAVKLTIPMVLCIFPALFVVILGPAVLNVLHALSSQFK